MLSITKYPYKSWEDTYPDSKVILMPNVQLDWEPLFVKLVTDARFEKIEKTLSADLQKNKKIYPYPDLIFSAFNYCSLEDTKVVIIGQDPYFKSEKGFPQAMGLSFSVPMGISVPSSLDNIYKNMIKYGIIYKHPGHGNLELWAYQGCLLLNTALTVLDNEKNVHSALWKWFTDEIIKYISDSKTNVVFVLWGSNAKDKLSLINNFKHEVIISSHPSGLSVHTPLGKYPAFENNDHFGKINAYLKKTGQKEIVFGL